MNDKSIDLKQSLIILICTALGLTMFFSQSSFAAGVDNCCEMSASYNHSTPVEVSVMDSVLLRKLMYDMEVHFRLD